jgi:hypothetical protein
MPNTPANLDKIKAAALRRKKQGEALRANLRRRKADDKPATTTPKPSGPEDQSHG